MYVDKGLWWPIKNVVVMVESIYIQWNDDHNDNLVLRE